MSKNPRPPRLAKAVLEALTGLEWRFDHGKKHWKIVAADGDLISVVGFGGKGKQPEYRDIWTIENIRAWRKKRGL